MYKTLYSKEIWTPEGRLIKWDSEGDRPLAPDTEPTSTPKLSRQSANPSHEVMMTLYQQFGEECAARSIVPSYRLFEEWLSADCAVGLN